MNCWVCGHADLTLVKRGITNAQLAADAFRISDDHYGLTADLYRCPACGFIQADHLPDVVPFYEAMNDPAYDATRPERALQLSRLLDCVGRHKPAGRLLDVGAGSGILVEEALRRGYAAEGLEPSRALVEQARLRNLPVWRGTFPDERCTGPYDVVALVDVLEHVQNPLALLASAARCLKDDGVLLLVTPDCGSVLARIMGWKWWHYRIAHVGYFNRRNLRQLVRTAGLNVLEERRPGWYFRLGYLVPRLMQYVPGGKHLRLPHNLAAWVVTLNLFDSIQWLCSRCTAEQDKCK